MISHFFFVGGLVMQTFRPTALFSTASFGRLIVVLTFAIILLGAAFADRAGAQDNVGIFWDTNYTQDSIETTSFPELLTGYLVLKDPSQASGILGWELCVDLEGPAQFLSWTVEGQHINASPPPCFAVGIAGEPLPSQGDVLLATFQILVNEPLPVALSLQPDYQPSLPGAMSFIPGYDSNALLPMTTLTGQPEVAWINGQIPNLVVSPITLHFENTYLGAEDTKYVTVSNQGNIVGTLNLTLGGDCAGFSLPAGGGIVSIQPGSDHRVPVTFRPLSTDLVFCNLVLGGMLDDVQMVGSGLVLDAGWEIPSLVDFGHVAIGSYIQRIVRVKNIGQVSFPIDPSIPASCPEFSIASGNYPGIINPGGTRTFTLQFNPSVEGTQECQFDLGSVVPSIDLVGYGRSPSYDWTLFPASLDFGTVGIGGYQDIVLVIGNTGELNILVEPNIPQSCPEFSIIDGGDPVIVVTGMTHRVTVRYAPQSDIQNSCNLELGTVIPDVAMTGVGREAILDWVAPTSHDYGEVPVGGLGTFAFQVFNSGDVNFLVDPSLPDTTQFFTLTQGYAVNLLPGQSTSITVRFNPLVPGSHAVDLDLGPTVPAVQLQGEATPLPPGWSVTPDALDFGWIYVGSYKELFVTIANTGGTFLDLDVNVDDPGLGFNIITGGGLHQLPPGQNHFINVRFRPQADGTFATNLNLGAALDPIPMTGSAETTSEICVFQPDSLIFGPVNTGLAQSKTVAVTNAGNQVLHMWPSTNSSKFTYSGSNRDLGPGQTGYFTVIFQSGSPGTFTGTLDLGAGVCSGVPLVGNAVTSGGGGENLVGIFFDPEFTRIEAETFNPNEVVEGYLVLTEPSEPTGVSAWELKASIDGVANWLQWDLEGQHINVGQGDEFIVGIGGDPLPPSQTILLATFQIFIPQPYPNIVYLELGPIYQASLPGQMVWAPGHDSSVLLPMYPLTGEPVVAGINWGPPVGIGNVAPRAQLTGAAVELQWPVPEGDHEGCHVYRRDDSGGDLRLTDLPLAGHGAVLEFTDRPGGYASGAVLHYSYSVVKNGVEGTRSPETDIRLAAMPQVLTRLLPNVPNPFNPQTEIRFELEKEQQIRVAVYDVTGRLVKVLEDGQLGAGPHARIWQGRDSQGRQVPSGAYYVRLMSQGGVDHQKIMLLK